MLKEEQIMSDKPRIASKTYQGVLGLTALSTDSAGEVINHVLSVVGLGSYGALASSALKVLFALYALYGRETAVGTTLNGIFKTSKT